ncbi:hypothetical protein HDV00_002382, partial [Rhizophlyctis rosea]
SNTDTGATYSYYQFVLNKNTHMLFLGNAQLDCVSDRRMKRDINEIQGAEALKMVESVPAKEADRGKLIAKVKEGFGEQDLLGLLRFLEVEEFKKKMQAIVDPYKKKLPKTKRVVVEEVDE